MSINKRQQSGFTLVEMLVVAPIIILAIGAFLTVLVSMTGEVIASRAANTMTYNTQDALRQIEQDVKQSATFLATNNVPITAGSDATTNSKQGYNDDTTAFTNVGTNGTTLILNMIGTTENPISSSSQIVYLKDQPSPCGTGSDNNIPLTYNVVYFVKNDTLWRRVVMPNQYGSTAYRCAAPWQQPSCTPSYMESASGVFCKTNDVRLIDGVSASGFTIDYFTGSSTTTPNVVAASAGATIAARSSALQAATTVKVSINASQNAGGREVSHTASIRATRLEGNASAVAVLTPPTTPAAPQLTLRSSPGGQVIVTWPAVQGAVTGYLTEYQVNNGAWTTPVLTGRSVTISTPYNESTVNVRVRATNSAGTSSYGTGSYTVPLWEPLVTTNGWSAFNGGFSTPAYTKTRSGLVLLRGVLKKSSAVASGDAIATMPVGYRPDGGSLMFSNSSNNASGRIDVTAAGVVSVYAGNATYVSLDSVRYTPSLSGLTRTTVTPLNSWAQYGSTWAPMTYVSDSSGRVVSQGLIRPGTVTSGTRLGTLPAALDPAEYLQIPSRSTNFAALGVDYRSGQTTFQTQTSGVTNYLTMNAIFYPASYSGWITPTLLNGWTASGGITSTPRYTKSTQDNVVTLKGTITGGSNNINNPMMNLPAGYRPKEQLIFTVVSNGAYARLDILPNGDVRMAVSSSAWHSFDGITFKAEQ